MILYEKNSQLRDNKRGIRILNWNRCNRNIRICFLVFFKFSIKPLTRNLETKRRSVNSYRFPVYTCAFRLIYRVVRFGSVRAIQSCSRQAFSTVLYCRVSPLGTFTIDMRKTQTSVRETIQKIAYKCFHGTSLRVGALFECCTHEHIVTRTNDKKKKKNVYKSNR